MKFWEKIGNIHEIGNLSHIQFRGSSDSGSKLGEQIAISDDWCVYSIDCQIFDMFRELSGDNRKAEIGVVVLSILTM